MESKLELSSYRDRPVHHVRLFTEQVPYDQVIYMDALVTIMSRRRREVEEASEIRAIRQRLLRRSPPM